MDSSHAGLKSRWESLDRFKTKKVAAAERQKNRQIESVKNMFEAELNTAAEECDHEKAAYQQELLDEQGSLDSVKPQPARKVRVRRGGADASDQGGGKRMKVAPFQSLMEQGSCLTEEE